MKYTFGKTMAAQKLETLLDDNPIARRKISRMISQYTSRLLKIVGARDPEIVRICLDLLRDDTLKRIDIIKGLNDDIRSHTKNLIMARYRIFRHCFDALVPLIEEMEDKES